MSQSLLALRKPLEPLELPTGHVVQVLPMDSIGLAMTDEIRTLALSGKIEEAVAMTAELLKRVIPEATERDLQYLSIQDQRNVITIAAGNIEILEASLGNASSAAIAPEAPAVPADKKNGSPRSRPRPKGSTSSRGSR